MAELCVMFLLMVLVLCHWTLLAMYGASLV